MKNPNFDFSDFDFKDNTVKDNNIGRMFGYGLVFCFFLILLAGSCNDSPRKDIYKDSFQKMDRGEELNSSERKAINDLINYKEKR